MRPNFATGTGIVNVQRVFEEGVAQHRAGQVANAERLYRQVLETDRNHEQASFLVAAIAIESDRSKEAVPILERLTALHPTNANYFANLGEAYRRLTDYERAAGALTRAVSLNPELVQAHFNLGLVMRALSEVRMALQAFERATELKPDSALIQYGLARALSDSGEHARAVGHFQCALVLNPKAPDVHADYAICLRKLQRFEGALRAANRALDLEPNNALAHHERSASLTELGRFDEAVASSEKALALRPDFASAHAGLAAALTFSGQLSSGIAAYRKAVELDPQDGWTHSNLLFLLGFHAGESAQSILDEARSWAKRHATPFCRHIKPHLNTPDADRKLRVGYVSSNFNDHCQSLFTLPLFRHHDRSQFALYAFASALKADDVTRELRTHFDSWSDISGLDAEAAAALIRAQGIDLLVDLTMHMSVSQLPIFACRPAPVQIAWLAYPGTTGLPAMDYRVTDRHLDPKELPPEPYSEASLVLPDTFWCYDPRAKEPAVSELPARSNGYITFGCLNSFWKLNEASLRLWARVLERVLNSRMLLLAPEGGAQERVRATFKAAGIAPERIDFVSRKPRAEYLKLYHRIDVCLDALPYNGHTTSLDAFWMGVPVLTLVGDTVVGRAGVCQALNLELPELVTQTPEEFVAAAARLTADLDALSGLRAGLRQKMERSPLMDAPRFARNLEAKYREAWQGWCENHAS
jgi:protein O-GlcNAc transferase